MSSTDLGKQQLLQEANIKMIRSSHWTCIFGFSFNFPYLQKVCMPTGFFCNKTLYSYIFLVFTFLNLSLQISCFHNMAKLKVCLLCVVDSLCSLPSLCSLCHCFPRSQQLTLWVNCFVTERNGGKIGHFGKNLNIKHLIVDASLHKLSGHTVFHTSDPNVVLNIIWLVVLLCGNASSFHLLLSLLDAVVFGLYPFQVSLVILVS